MFTDVELKEILRYLDIYHNNNSSSINKNRAFNFISNKFKDNFPGITDRKIKEFINSSKETIDILNETETEVEEYKNDEDYKKYNEDYKEYDNKEYDNKEYDKDYKEYD